MNIAAQKNEKERIFDELIDVKLLYKKKEKKWKQLPVDALDKIEIKSELMALKIRIEEIEKNITRYGDSFFDVYDAELDLPLSESDILVLRDEIREVRHSLEAIGKN